ncbi:hypothetical protein, partial [Caulobacter sp. 17J65-9]|uniref:hypothetical protein n=1 Tax=Caulobacter sp. 17J65-9 TaxID=2709382 RepID=UPI0013CA9485
AVLYPAWEATLPWTATAADRGDWAAARAGLEKASALPVLGAPPYDRIWRATGAPLLAEALARTGELARGRALAATTPTDSLPGLLARARIAELAGDRREADRWFAEASRQSPSLPQPDAAWGEAKLGRGDLEGAIALFHTAQKKGPRWADPLKFEGDILVRQDNARAALKRYAAAAERAPRWGALHLAWGDALERLGRRDDARAKWRAAAGMDLSAA